MHVSSLHSSRNKRSFCRSSWKEGRHHISIFSFFSKEDETEKQAIEKTLVIPISLSTPGLEKMLSGSVWIKKGFYLGGGRNKDYIFKTKK